MTFLVIAKENQMQKSECIIIIQETVNIHKLRQLYGCHKMESLRLFARNSRILYSISSINTVIFLPCNKYAWGKTHLYTPNLLRLKINHLIQMA